MSEIPSRHHAWQRQHQLILVATGLFWSVTAGALYGEQEPVPRKVAESSGLDTSPNSDGPGLPWKKKSDVLQLKELLAPIGFETAYWESFQSGKTLDSPSMVRALRLLDRLARFTPDQWAQWAVPMPAELSVDTSIRGSVFDVQGFVTAISGPYSLEDEGLQGFQLDHYFIANVESDSGAIYRVICRQLPAIWRSQTPLRESARLRCVLLAAGGDASAWLVADRLEWYATSPRSTAQIALSDAWQFLGTHGLDLGRLEDAKTENQQILSSDEREAFYGILKVLADEPDDWSKVPKTAWRIPELLKEPAKFQGQRLAGRAVARRVTRIMVDDPAITRRTGIESYFQVDAFFPLDGVRIRLTNPAGAAGPAPVYANGYPATIVCRELPNQLLTAAADVLNGTAKTQLIQIPVVMDGVFLKLWSYRSPFLTRDAEEQRHPSPLFIASELRAVPPARVGKSSEFSFVVLGVFLAFFSGAVVLAWWAQRK